MSLNEQLTTPNFPLSEPSWFVKPLVRAIKNRLGKIRSGSMALTLPSGDTLRFAGPKPGPAADIQVRDWRLFRRVFWGGDVAFGEAYVDGDWDTSDIARVIEFFGRNTTGASNPYDSGLIDRLLNRMRHRANPNTRGGSRKNISFHYDLGNAFYREWLDPTMTYSAALFEKGEQDLKSAQDAKYRRLCEAVGLKTGMRVLEIGCGWGGFAEFAAREYGAEVTGITISERQFEYSKSRMKATGLDGQVDIRFQDFRELEGQFDAIVSIEMFEAIGEALWQPYFSKVSELLKPGAKAAFQIILIDEDRYERYRRSPDFIQLHIFPGGMLPSASRVIQSAESTGLAYGETFLFGADYAQTLEHWERSFLDALPRIAEQGFDARFERLWLYYLAYCRGGFASGTIDVGHFLFAKPR